MPSEKNILPTEDTFESEKRPRALSSKIKRSIVRTLSIPAVNRGGYFDVDSNLQETENGYNNEAFEDSSEQLAVEDRECVIDVVIVDPIDWFQMKFSEWSPGGVLTLRDFRAMNSDLEVFGEQMFKLLDVEKVGSLILTQLITTFKNFTQGRPAAKVVPWFNKILRNKFKDKPLTVDNFKELIPSEGFLEHIYQLLDLDSKNGLVQEELISNLSRLKLLSKHSFDVAWVELQFRKHLGSDKYVTLQHFKKIFDAKNEFFTERVFNWFDKKKEGFLKLEDFIESLHNLSRASESEKVRFLFSIYDLGEKGVINPYELRTVLKSCLDESKISLDEIELDDLTWALFEDVDVNNSGTITYDELERELKTHDGLLENLSISATHFLRPKISKPTKPWWPHYLTKKFFRNNISSVIFIVLYFVINIILFTYRVIIYALDGYNPFVCLARGCGQCLNFNCTFIVIFMFRNILTWLRSSKAGMFLPIDRSIEFHKMVGFVILFFGILHTFAHIGNIIICTQITKFESNLACGCIYVSASKNTCDKNNVTDVIHFNFADYLFTTKPQIGGMFGLPGITGFFLTIILIVMVICALPFVRKKGHFEVFYWTHMLYIPFWILLIPHCTNFWKWFIGPGIIYTIERILRMKVVKRARYGRTFIKEGLILPSKVTHLVINRPANFYFHPGDYIFINISAIAEYEWHPFTISSAPEQTDVIWLHIRAVGTWTESLYRYFEEPSYQVEEATVNRIINTAHENSPVKRMISNSLEVLNRKKSVLDTAPANSSIEDEKSEPVKRPSKSKKRESVRFKDTEGKGEVSLKSLGNHQTLSRVTSSPASLLSHRATYRFLSRLSSLSAVQEDDENEGESVIFKDEVKLTKVSAYPSLRITEKVKDLQDKNIKVDEGDTHTKFSRATSLNPALMQRRLTYKYQKRESLGRTVSVLSRVSLNSNAQDFSHLRRQPTSITVITEAQPNIHVETEVFIDGPYGTPSSNIFQAEHAVLIAAGIGVTPAASILQSIMHRYRNAKRECPQCQHTWTADIPSSVMNLQKVDFYWINRDQKSFEWFVHLLSQLEIEQKELGGAMDRFLNLHMFMTGALEKTDMKAIVLQLAMDKLHTKEKKDLITGLRTRTQAGRPNWNKIFRQLRQDRKGKITVFFCGPSQLSKLLQQKCDEHGFQFRKENF